MSTTPLGLPPGRETILSGEQIANQVVKEHLLDPERLAIHDILPVQRAWHEEYATEALFSSNVSAPTTSIVVESDPFSGETLGFREVQQMTGGQEGGCSCMT